MQATTRELSTGLVPGARRAGPPPTPLLAAPWSARELTPRGADLDLVHRWMNEPHVVASWGQAWSRERWAAELRGQLEGEHSRPHLVCLDDQPLAYVEIYRVARDVVATRFPVHPHDLGVHVAIGEVGRTGRGLGTATLCVVSDGLLRAEAACTRILGDPAAEHEVACRAFAAAGFRPVCEVDLPHKRALLFVRPRGDDEEASGG